MSKSILYLYSEVISPTTEHGLPTSDVNLATLTSSSDVTTLPTTTTVKQEVAEPSLSWGEKLLLLTNEEKEEALHIIFVVRGYRIHFIEPWYQV